MPFSFARLASMALIVTVFDAVARAESTATAASRWSPVGLNANQMSIATGQPSLVVMSKGSTHLPVWSLSGGTAGQSVAGVVTGLPGDCAAVKASGITISIAAPTT